MYSAQLHGKSEGLKPSWRKKKKKKGKNRKFTSAVPILASLELDSPFITGVC